MKLVNGEFDENCEFDQHQIITFCNHYHFFLPALKY